MVNEVLKLLGLTEKGVRSEGENLFSVPSTPFSVKNNLVQYSDMPMFFGRTFALHFLDGRIGLEDKSLSMDVEVPLSKDGDSQSSQKLIFPLSGTLDKPRLDTSKMLQKQAEGAIKDIIQDQLKNILK
jgi:hypothetical protein